MQTLRILFVCLLLGIGPVTVTLAREVKILDMNGQLGDTFGYVSISGDTAIVGAPRHDGNKGKDSGSVYVFVNIGRRWKEQATFTASDVSAGDQLGTSVAISRDTVIVGAPDNADTGRESGAAYIFVRSGEKWKQQAKLTPDDGAQQDKFGISVSIFHNTAIVGASGRMAVEKMLAQRIPFSALAHRGSRGQRSFPATRQIVTSSEGPSRLEGNLSSSGLRGVTHLRASHISTGP